ncbi:hypothetical protein SAMN04488094_10840 [Tropicimonas isoalkanivorans]|uniref:Uncharacterized protein n=1 Tax=Tropicimonas isoalkanivorans TaxID=441112 RepID=A0A1I1LBP7_9RHOB|nr:hypothetical protein SAMN04488094_10840 [Tropicimonas isoalkanivorans]
MTPKTNGISGAGRPSDAPALATFGSRRDRPIDTAQPPDGEVRA